MNTKLNFLIAFFVFSFFAGTSSGDDDDDGRDSGSKGHKGEETLVLRLDGTGFSYSVTVPDIDGDGEDDDAICFDVDLIDLKKDRVAKGDVTGVIGLTGAANGTVSVTFQRGSILKIVSSMFGEEITTVDGDVADAVVELTNMISGQARKELEKTRSEWVEARIEVQKTKAELKEAKKQNTISIIRKTELEKARNEVKDSKKAQEKAKNEAEALKMIGIKPIDGNDKVTAGGHLMNKDGPVNATHDQGYVTSAAFSPSLNSMIGLGFLKNGDERLGEKMRLVSPVTDLNVDVEIVSAHFIDPEGGRQRA